MRNEHGYNSSRRPQGDGQKPHRVNRHDPVYCIASSTKRSSSLTVRVYDDPPCWPSETKSLLPRHPIQSVRAFI